jgi:hypothetical protein
MAWFDLDLNKYVEEASKIIEEANKFDLLNFDGMAIQEEAEAAEEEDDDDGDDDVYEGEDGIASATSRSRSDDTDPGADIRINRNNQRPSDDGYRDDARHRQSGGVDKPAKIKGIVKLSSSSSSSSPSVRRENNTNRREQPASVRWAEDNDISETTQDDEWATRTSGTQDDDNDDGLDTSWAWDTPVKSLRERTEEEADQLREANTGGGFEEESDNTTSELSMFELDDDNDRRQILARGPGKVTAVSEQKKVVGLSKLAAESSAVAHHDSKDPPSGSSVPFSGRDRSNSNPVVSLPPKSFKSGRKGDHRGGSIQDIKATQVDEMMTIEAKSKRSKEKKKAKKEKNSKTKPDKKLDFWGMTSSTADDNTNINNNVSVFMDEPVGISIFDGDEHSAVEDAVSYVFGNDDRDSSQTPSFTESMTDTAQRLPQRIVLGLSGATQAFSFFDKIDDEVDLSEDPILKQVELNKSNPMASSSSSYLATRFPQNLSFLEISGYYGSYSSKLATDNDSVAPITGSDGGVQGGRSEGISNPDGTVGQLREAIAIIQTFCYFIYSQLVELTGLLPPLRFTNNGNTGTSGNRNAFDVLNDGEVSVCTS